MKKTITVTKDGPFIFNSIEKIQTQNGNQIELKETTSICRCGESFEKPFCDGSHIIFDFKDEKDVYRVPDKIDVYKGKIITIYDNRSVCSHRGICYEELSEVFKMSGGVFIDPDGADVDKIIDICKRCPSGALSYSINESKRNLEAEEGDWEVRLAPRRYGYDGPIEVRGDVELIDEAGSHPESSEHYALCRCGKSKNMPFCSGEHWKAKFIDENNDEYI
ncbi:MAG: CDGSH iron-sulfur domain-containing protein [Acidaminobacteraceae bacterium]